MRKEYKVLICILALIFSIGATCIGFGLIGSSSLKFGMKYVCDFVFLMQTIATCWVVDKDLRFHISILHEEYAALPHLERYLINMFP